MASDYRNLLEQSPADVRNPYMDLLDEEDQDEKQRLRGSLSGAVTVAPDKFAAQKQVARYLGYPTSVVEALPDTEREAKVQSIDEQTANAPATRRKFTDEDFAKLAHDDVGNLTAFERLLRGAKGAGDYLTGLGTDGKASLAGDVSAGVWRANRGAAGVFQAGVEAIAPLIDPLAGTILPENPLRRMADALAGAGRLSEERAAQVSPAPGGIVAGGVSSGVQSLTQNILTLPVTLSNPAAGLTMMSGITGGQAYQQGREKGLGAPESLALGASQAVIEYATEKIPVQKLIGDIAKDAGLARTVVNQLAAELPGEQVATILQDLNEWAALNPEKPFAEYLKERPSAAAQTLIATIVGVGGNVVVAKGIDRAVTTMQERAERAARAEETAQRLEQMDLLAAANKVRQRDPETFEGFIRDAAEDGPVTHVYVSAETLAQSPNVEALAAVSPSIAAQLPQALATGGTVQIPIEEYATHIAGTELNQGLIDELRTEPDGFSRREAKEFMQSQAEDLRAEVERVVAQKADDDTFKASIAQVRDQIKGQLDATQRFKGEVNEAYATMMSNFYGVMAAKIGMTPDALLAQYPIRIGAESIGGRELDQGRVSRVLFRGTTGSSERIKGGIAEGTLFAAADRDIAESYAGTGGRIEQIGVRPDAKILVEGSAEFAKVTGRRRGKLLNTMRRGENLKTAADEAVAQARAAGYDAVEFTSMRDLGIAVLNEDKFIRDYNDDLNQSPYTGDTIEVDGQARPTTNSNGQRIAETEEGLRAFWRWFGDSKVVDAEGRPLVVYHGTSADFAEFDALKTRDVGFHFGGAEAANYVGERERQSGKDALLLPVYLALNNPLRIEDTNFSPFQFVKALAGQVDRGVVSGLSAKELRDLGDSFATGAGASREAVSKTVTYLLDKGFDGLVYSNRKEKGGDSFVVFQPEQIKSAVGNRGTFDPADANILNQAAYHGTPHRFDKFSTDAIGGRELDQGGLAEVRKQWADAGIENAVFEKNGTITLSQIVVPKGERGTGKGTAAMQQLVDYADRTGQRVVLSPSSDFGGNKKRLVEFYKRFGFVQNKGKNKDFTTQESMIRPARAPLNQSAYTGDTIEVDGVTRPTTNSNGQPIAETEEALRAFWKWFGDSKVVDAERRPLVVYHGTPNMSFSEFDAETLGSNTRHQTSGVGFYFTAWKDGARNYADRGGKKGRLIEAYLRIESPLIESWSSMPRSSEDAATMRSVAVEQGLDGIFVDDENPKLASEIVVFNPEQIKSAVGNRGTFDPADANILNQPAYHGTPHRGIEKFSTDAIGTGEGAQAYGWGLYFASRKEIAEHYRKTLAAEAFFVDGQRIDENNPVHVAAATLETERGDRESAINLLRSEALTNYSADKRDVWTAAADVLESGAPLPAVTSVQGQLYEVEVPEDDVLLDWDKPLSEQPEKVRAAIGGSFAQYVQPKVEIYWTLDGRRLDTSDPDFLRTQRVASMGYEAVLAEAEATVEKRKDRPENDPLRLSADRVLANVKAFAGREAKQVTRELDVVEADVTGEALYKGMERVLGSDKAASEALAKLGIKGIKYLDGGSRSSGDGTHNYVIFSGDDVAITNQFYQKRGANRGSFRPADLTITLLKDADLSTFLHESGHFFLEVQFDLASRIGAKDPATLTPGERELLADTSALLQWFGVPDVASWYNLDFEEQRSYHERFARGFESYLFEGKAPSIELHGLFQRFRSWLVNIYRELRNLNVELSDEVRGVFDRMLATNEQIQLAEQARSMMPLFESPDQAGMTVEEFAAYQALGTQATADAIEDLQARGLRDMAYSHNARGRVVKRLQKQAEELRREVRAEVRTEVMSRPVYRAWTFLTTKDEDGGKLSREALVEAYGGDGDQYALLDWKRLTDLRMTAKEGMHPDMVADLFGFSSGDELVRALLAAEKPDVEIEGLTDSRMLEEHGELSSQDAIEREADRAVHNDVRARMVATEANALAKAVSTSEKVGTDKRGRPVMRPILPRAAREFAAAMIARLRIRDIRPQQYTNAEVRAAREAQKASQAGDLATAAAEKRNQLVNVYAARAAYDAQEEIDAALKYLRKFSSEGSRKGLDVDYLDQIDALLERFDLRASQSLKAVDKRAALAAWIESQREQGLEPDLPPELLNEAFRKSYKDMTVEEFRGLVDSIKQIEHLGRLKKKLLTAKDQREYEAVRDEIVARIHDKAQGRTANTRTPTTPIGLTLQQLRRFWAAHIKAATWARIFDGDANGPVWNYLIRPANDRADMETTMRAEATERLHEILAPIFKLGRMSGSGTFFPSINRSLNRQERIAIALNVGNEGNLQRLLGGEGWQMSQVVPVLKSLTAVEWQAVQEVWDHLETYRPLIAEKERRVYGKEPEWVEPRPFGVTTADGQTLSLRGGYYPIKFDPAASQRAEQYADAEEAQRQLRGAYTSATTRRSFTKSRVDEVVGRPLLYNLSGLYSGVNDVIHDLAWHEWLIDANRLLRSQSIDAAIRGHYGPEAKAQLKSWVADVAEGERGAANAGELALGRLRQGVSAAGLGFNVMSAAMQPLGFTQSIVRVGATWVGRGIARTLASPLGTAKMVNEKSEFMRNRARTRFRELNELRNKVQDENVPLAVAKQGTYFLMMRAQQLVDIPTWVGAYEKAIADQQPEDRAVSLADQAVIDAQGGGQLKDLAAVERGGPALKLFTVFYSFMNTALNLGVAQTMTQRNKAKIAVDYLLLFTVPAIMGTLLKDALQPGGDDDDEDLARKLIAAQLEYLMGLMVVVREFGAVGKIVAGAEGVRDYQGPAGVRVVSDVVKLGQQTAQGEFDDAFRKAAVNVIGDLTGLPSAQVNKTITGAQALEEGETENPAALVFGYSAQ